MNADHHQNVNPRLVKSQKRSNNKRKQDSLKVVYISSPMKVKTSASRFRSLVQQLTGKNSDISQYMDEGNIDGLPKDFQDFGCDEIELGGLSSNNQVVSSISSDETTTSSDTFLSSMDNIFVTSHQMEGQFDGIFSSDFLCDVSQMDVLGSYDELL